jgi:hypothetical protein
MSPEERRHICNAIWLCSDHAALIDRDCATYTIECLRDMKRRHEMACAETLRHASRDSGDELTILSPSVPTLVCTGELLSVDSSERARRSI